MNTVELPSLEEAHVHWCVLDFEEALRQYPELTMKLMQSKTKEKLKELLSD